ncbi:DUF4747 family protein [Pseudomonas sp. UMAB-08]|uniref:DUF4747 family protein n=1 Tax=Pseudomonas sp. UMAB-08 TaxID=1365375 RepID=UPI001C57F932|nr:DUF4747 family protein [Pseudomonas sp. UMAB-08]
MAGKQNNVETEGAHGRDKKISVSCLNLVLHPHTPKKYVDFLSTLNDMKIAIKVRGDDALCIGSFLKDEDGDAYVGEIHKYLNLDASADWYNVKRNSIATKADVDGVVIPDDLRPHFKKYQFVFFPEGHRFFYVSKSSTDTLSPALLKKFFEGASMSEALASFGNFAVTVEPQVGSSEKLFLMPRISRIDMEINRPNPDDHAGLDAQVQERLRRINAKKEILAYVAADSVGLQPDAELKGLALVAASNGKVVVKGRNDSNEIVTQSTENLPLTEPASYNPDIQSERSVLVEVARSIRQVL